MKAAIKFTTLPVRFERWRFDLSETFFAFLCCLRNIRRPKRLNERIIAPRTNPAISSFTLKIVESTDHAFFRLFGDSDASAIARIYLRENEQRERERERERERGASNLIRETDAREVRDPALLRFRRSPDFGYKLKAIYFTTANADSQSTVTGIRLGPAFPSDPRSSNPVRREYEIYERRDELRLKSRLRPARFCRRTLDYCPLHTPSRT